MYILFFLILLLNYNLSNSFKYKPKIKHKIIVHKIENNKCGQTHIKPVYFNHVKKMSNIKNGTCSSDGYNKYCGKEIHKIPFIGKLLIFKFIKNNQDCSDDQCDI